MTHLELLTTEEMAAADRLAVAAGTPSLKLMENAGKAIAEAAEKMVRKASRIAVICGPGNNGGDGFVAARILQRRGYEVRVALLGGDRKALTGDAATMAAKFTGPVEKPDGRQMAHAKLVIDALFGAGLSRPVEGDAAYLIEEINDRGVPIVSVDVPSGLDGNSGLAGGAVVKATRTITFFRRKPGHLLLPGRLLCGETVVADIGIPGTVLNEIKPKTYVNDPALWIDDYPWPALDSHKYNRGHAVVVSGPPEGTGAARLGARAALRIGAGLVTLASSPAALTVNASHLTAVMLKTYDDPSGLSLLLADRRKNAVLIGPGVGLGPLTRQLAEILLASGAATVLDADALTVWGGDTARLAVAIAANPARPVVITPHEGEFDRLFGREDGVSKVTRARAAARKLGAVVVLKGADTVIVAPDGRATINENAPPWLATAGSGDVLAGLVTGLLAQGVPAFEAASAAVWLHGECAAILGPGLISEELAEAVPKALVKLREAAPAR